MHRRVPPFQFVVCAPPGQGQATQVAWQALAAQLRSAVPEAAVVVVSSRLGVNVLDRAGESLDLEALPWDCIEDAVALLGTGAFVLPREGVGGSEVQEPWKSQGRPESRKG